MAQHGFACLSMDRWSDLSILRQYTKGNVMSESIQNAVITQEQRQVALAAVFKMLKLWGCSSTDEMTLLGGVPKSTLHKMKSEPGKVRVSSDLLERLSYLLNIKMLLTTKFDNSENQYGFMKMINHNAPFNGIAPLSYAVTTGTVVSLHTVSAHLDGLRGGGW